MRALAYLSIVVFLAGGGGLLGYLIGRAKGHHERLRALGFTRNSAALYQRCINLLNRMTRITELDGDFSEDVLSDPTRKEIDGILAAHRKELTNQ